MSTGEKENGWTQESKNECAQVKERENPLTWKKEEMGTVA